MPFKSVTNDKSFGFSSDCQLCSFKLAKNGILLELQVFQLHLTSVLHLRQKAIYYLLFAGIVPIHYGLTKC